jgi:hypothetical protein
MKHNKKTTELTNNTDQFLEAYANRYVSVIKQLAEAKVADDDTKSSSEILTWAKSVGAEAGEWALEKLQTPTGQKILTGLMNADRLGNSIQGWVADPDFWSLDYAKQGWNHEKNFDYEDAWRGDKPLQGDAPDGQSVSWGDRKGFADHASYIASVPFNMILDPINLAAYGAGKAVVGTGKAVVGTGKAAVKTKAGQAVASTAKKAAPMAGGVAAGAYAGKKAFANESITEDSDSTLERVVTIITDAVENGHELFDFAKILQADGFQAESSTSPVGHVRVQGEDGDILIYSTKYLEDGEDATIVGRYAIGIEG